MQELTFSGFEEDTAVNEVQTIEVETPGSFRIGLFGVYTGPLTTAASESMVADAVNALPVWGAEESVTVVRAQSSIATFEFTFNSNRGNVCHFAIVYSRGVATAPLLLRCRPSSDCI